MSFQNTVTMKTCLSDFFRLTMTILTTTSEKLILKKVIYRGYENFDKDKLKRVGNKN